MTASKVLVLSDECPLPTRWAILHQGFYPVWLTGLLENGTAVAAGGSWSIDSWRGLIAAAVVDCSHLAEGTLSCQETIRVLTAKGIPCIALSPSGRDQGMKEAGALRVLRRDSLADRLYNGRLRIARLSTSDRSHTTNTQKGA